MGTGAGAAQWREFVAAQKTDEQWAALLSARGRPVAERERATLVAYLSVNMPLPAAALQGQSSEAIVGALPRDGRDLAWNQCQFCHSLFSSHLTQSRDVQGWRNMFLSPFHRELKMTPKEREEFSRYSAINMPMKVEDVPPEFCAFNEGVCDEAS